MDKKDKNDLDPKSKKKKEKEHKETIEDEFTKEALMKSGLTEEEVNRREELKQIEDDINRMVQEMEDYLEKGMPNVKIITLDKRQKRIMTYHLIIEIVLSIVLLFSSLGYLKWLECDKLYQYFILVGGIVLLEYVTSYLIKKLFLKMVIFSGGLILYLAPIFGFIISVIFAPGAVVLNFGLMFVVLILYIIVKKIFMTFIKGDYRKLFNKE